MILEKEVHRLHCTISLNKFLTAPFAIFSFGVICAVII
nr:MAG TPA: hypothetical protein [Caudoviricetes sp.]